jgi:hypothetical protein
LDVEFAEMVNGIEEEKRVASTVGFLDMFRSRNLAIPQFLVGLLANQGNFLGTDLRRTLLCMGTVAADSGGTGALFLIPYVTYFLLISGVPVNDVFHYIVINTCLGLVSCNIGLFVMRHVCGRRTFLMLSAVFNGLFMLGLAVSATLDISPATA